MYGGTAQLNPDTGQPEIINEDQFSKSYSRAIASDRRPDSENGNGAGEGETPAGDKAVAAGSGVDTSGVIEEEAAAILEAIYSDFSRMRNEGRSSAWAELENKIADNAAKLILSKLISPKDLTGLLIDIEQFRKTDMGTTQLPGDFLKQWLSEPTTPSSETVNVSHLPKREKKIKKVRKESA